MLKFDNLSIDLNYDTIELAKAKDCPILISDEQDLDAGVEMSLNQARWIRDNIGYIIERLEE